MTSSSHADLVLRRGTLADAAVIIRNNLAMARETEHIDLDPERLGAGVRAVLGDEARGRYWLAERDGEVVGQLMVTCEWSDWRNGRIEWIQSVYVVPGARRTGVYRALWDLQRAAAEADPEVVGLRLYVHTDNTLAQEVYGALGMRRADYQVYEVDFVLER